MFLTQPTQLLLDCLVTLAYPQPCALCGQSVERRSLGIACEECWNRTRVFTESDSICWKCGVPSSGYVSKEREEVRCHRCESCAFENARAAGLYQGALRESVVLLKRQPHLPGHLLRLLASLAKHCPLNEATRIIPVPLHPNRLRERGFNQARVIASSLSNALGLPVDDVSLIRVSHSIKHRAGMDAKGRL